MKNIYLLFICFISQFCIAQQSVRDMRCVRVRSCIDTTNTQFKEIFDFWENYQDDLFRNQFYKDSVCMQKYWAESEFLKYENPDIVLRKTKIYFMLPELFLGIEIRNDTLFEIKSLYSSVYMKPNSDMYLLFSTYVIKKNGNYFLYNKFSENKKKLKEYSKEWLHIYYTDDYKFNNNEAINLFERANKLLKDFDFYQPEPVHYYLAPTYTELLDIAGIDFLFNVYIPSSNIKTGGWSKPDSRLIFYSQGGEANLHEFIHIFIHDFRKNIDFKDYDLDEGFCCYFGDHLGFPYKTHAKRLKIFLNNNPEINLSENLQVAFLVNNKKYYSDTINIKFNYNDTIFLSNFYDDSTNYSYIIMAAICEIAMQKGGIELLKQMLLEITNDNNYEIIEKYLGIKRKDLNSYIRNFLNENY
ncbi:MAG: hypothetical protein LBV69_07680 [Bacteroidales bacterium]|jgi:hypothetical protein|nr:hypothetical protein [Bacteroidales bacterium]